LVTGVGHREGIGFAIARRLLEDGVKVMVHSLTTDDAVLADLGGGRDSVAAIEADFGDRDAPHMVIGALSRLSARWMLWS
jgi:3-oxoacyl-[acyl-carrier protein] reductase